MQLIVYPMKEVSNVTRKVFSDDPQLAREVAENFLIVNAGLKVYQSAKNLGQLDSLITGELLKISRIYQFNHFSIFSQLVEGYLNSKDLSLEDITGAVVTDLYVSFAGTENWLLDDLLQDDDVKYFAAFCENYGIKVSLDYWLPLDY